MARTLVICVIDVEREEACSSIIHIPETLAQYWADDSALLSQVQLGVLGTLLSLEDIRPS